MRKIYSGAIFQIDECLFLPVESAIPRHKSQFRRPANLFVCLYIHERICSICLYLSSAPSFCQKLLSCHRWRTTETLFQQQRLSDELLPHFKDRPWRETWLTISWEPAELVHVRKTTKKGFWQRKWKSQRQSAKAISPFASPSCPIYHYCHHYILFNSMHYAARAIGSMTLRQKKENN